MNPLLLDRVTLHRSPLDPRAGFSLLEVIVALGVLAVGISSAVALFAAATGAHKRAIDRVRLTGVVEQAIADIESTLALGVSPEEIVQEPPLAELQIAYPEYQVQLAFYDVVDSDSGLAQPDEMVLELRVSWVYRGGRREEVFQQVIAAERRLSVSGWEPR